MGKEKVRFDLGVFDLADRMDGNTVQVQVTKQEQVSGTWETRETQNNVFNEHPAIEVIYIWVADE